MKLKAIAEGVNVTVSNKDACDIYEAMDLMYQLLAGMGFHSNSITKGIHYLFEQYGMTDEFIGAPGGESGLDGLGVNFEPGEA